MTLLEVVLIVVAVTLPFGFYRARVPKFSWRWFLAVHLPVPLVLLARIAAHLPYYFIPVTCTAFFTGQLLGGLASGWWTRRRVQRSAAGYPPAGGSTLRSRVARRAATARDGKGDLR